MWRDKAKARWIDEGDANTHFFHLLTVIYRRYNAIPAIVNTNNVWIRSRREIGMEFQAFFSNLFTSTDPQFPISLQNLTATAITPPMNNSLRAIPSSAKIQSALFNMGNHKSLGPDSMPVLFYKTY